MPNAITLKSFFGFARHPFPPSCPPDPLYRDDTIDAALEQAKNALLNRLHVLVTAAPGLGKSSLCRLLLSELNPRDLRAAYLVGQRIGPTDFLQNVAEALGLEAGCRRGRAAQLLTRGLQQLAASSGPHPVLVLDEAQQVPIDAIELLRLVAEDGGKTLLSLVIVGDESLRRQLARPALTALAGRLAVRIQIAPMSEEQTARFVEHVFGAVGMQNIVAPTAVAMVHAAAGGSPRKVGTILMHGMRRALQKRSKLLTDEIVQEVIDELRE